MPLTAILVSRSASLTVRLGGTETALMEAQDGDIATATHVVASILIHAPMRAMAVDKAVAIAHLADRIHMSRWGAPLVACGWHMTAGGPVTSIIHALAHARDPHPAWEAVVRGSGGILRLAPGITARSLDELSRAADESVAMAVSAFGAMDADEIARLMRERLPECRDMRPRRLRDELVLAVCGVRDPRRLMEQEEGFRWTSRLFARMAYANDRDTDKAV